MSHHCSTLVLHCIDFRLGRAIKEWMERERLQGDSDIVAAAGAAKNIVEPKNPSDCEFILRQIEISKRLHDIKSVILLNHTDCGAYGDVPRSKHIEDLGKASVIVESTFPGLTVRRALGNITPDGAVTIEELK